MERHPATEEHGRCYTSHDEKVEELCQIVESERQSGVLYVVAGGKLALCLSQVEWATVGFCITCNEENDECNKRGDVALEYEPAERTVLRVDYTADFHCANKNASGNQAQCKTYLIAYHLHRATHCADHRVLIVRRPTGKEHAKHSEA